MQLDATTGSLRLDPDLPALHGRVTLDDVRSSPLGATARAHDAGDELTELRLDLREGRPFVPPAELALEFHRGRLERVSLSALEPPVPWNPRWRRQEDEQERSAHHAAWLADAGLTPGWFPWGELACGWNSALGRSALRVRYSLRGLPWPRAWAPGGFGWVDPARRLDAWRGALSVLGETPVLAPGLRVSAWRRGTLGRRAWCVDEDTFACDLAPGTLMDHAAQLRVRFGGGVLRDVAFFPRSEAFGTSWSDHGPAEAEALFAALRAWLDAAGRGADVRGAWGTAEVAVDARGGAQAVVLRYVAAEEEDPVRAG